MPKKIKSKNFLAKILTSLASLKDDKMGYSNPFSAYLAQGENECGQKISELQSTLTPKGCRMDRRRTKEREHQGGALEGIGVIGQIIHKNRVLNI